MNKKPYVESTATIDKVHKLGGHTGDIISPRDSDTINRLQRRLRELDDQEWNELMVAKQDAVDTMNQWISMQ